MAEISSRPSHASGAVAAHAVDIDRLMSSEDMGLIEKLAA
jgi:hypothetical protein